MSKANHILNDKIENMEKKSQEIIDEFIKNINSKSYPNIFFSEIQKVEQNEIHRKEIIESKASSLLNNLGFLVTLIMIIITIFLNYQRLPIFIVILEIFLFLIIVINLILAIIYASKVIEMGYFNVISTDSIKDWMLNSSKDLKNLIFADKFVNLKINQLRLIKKNNYLSIAQTFFKRGITFLLFPVMVVFIYIIYN